ncbi:hypothetical protein L6452_13184 [Arctium lappa]|uniref:Uncharacterized protein n=1 Tax=Arctium lappa TaxID=4217 RepID=A0ACB9CHS6_ARCLA|nr:hypothetical protein L6452_13184 [Arctium lappa]
MVLEVVIASPRLAFKLKLIQTSWYSSPPRRFHSTLASGEHYPAIQLQRLRRTFFRYSLAVNLSRMPPFISYLITVSNPNRFFSREMRRIASLYGSRHHSTHKRINKFWFGQNPKLGIMTKS